MRNVRWVAIPLLVGIAALSGCKKDSTSAGGPISCSLSDPVCPPAGLSAGFSGVTGAPTIAPSGAPTTVSVSNSSYGVTGATNSTTNGVWLLVTGNTLRAWGVLAISGGTFTGDIPLFCGAQGIIYSFNNGSGRSYYLVNVTLTACTTASFRVQLTWNTGPSSDMDLHLLRPGGSTNTGNDCYYANCQVTGLEWGVVGAAGDPILDVDDTEGYGPENIFITSGAEAGQYRIVVRNFDDTPSTICTVKIFFNDIEAARYTSVALDSPNNTYWEVAKVVVATQQITTVNAYSSSAPVAAGVAAGPAASVK